MKVCQLCAVDFTLNKFLLPLIDGMTERGWIVTAVCSDGPSVGALRQRGYRIETLPIARRISPFAALQSLINLFCYFRKERFDVLHVHTPIAAFIGRIAGRLAGIPLIIYTAHGFYFHDDMSWWKRYCFIALERLSGLLTDLLFCQSREDAEVAIHERIMPESCILLIGNGVDIHQFDPDRVGNGQGAREGLGIPTDAFVVGLIARQVREKGIVEFLEAVNILMARYPRFWAVLIGEKLESDHAGEVERELTSAKTACGGRLLALGSRSDIPELLAAMDVFCLPSWREGLPRTIIEAMMMGKPVIATNIRGSREEVVHNETGLLIPLRSPLRIAEAIERLMNAPEWSRQLGRAARIRALTFYDERETVAIQLDRVERAACAFGLLDRV